MGISFWHIIIVLVVVLLLFGFALGLLTTSASLAA